MTEAAVIFTDVTAVDAEGPRPNTWIAVRDGLIHAVGQGEADPDLPGQRVAFGGGRMLPGFIDLHCHGGGGYSTEGSAADLSQVAATHLRHGTTRTVVSLVSAPIDVLEAQLDTVRSAMTSCPGILGAHLEGPFLAAGHCGAHVPAHLLPPDRALLGRLLNAADGSLQHMTIAPELAGADEVIDQLLDAGVAVALGHTDASYAQTRSAFDRGARILTHAFNGMPPMHHREPGPVLAAIEDDRVVLEVIADGVHVHDAMLRMAITQAPGRVAAVTDAMCAAGSGDGTYRLGGVEVAVRGGEARTSEDALAGSTTTQDAELRRLVACGVPLPDAVRALTEVPARALGLQESLGAVRPGMSADLVAVDADLNITAVWQAGRQVLTREPENR